MSCWLTGDLLWLSIFHVLLAAAFQVARFEGLGKASSEVGGSFAQAAEIPLVQTLKVWQQESDPESWQPWPQEKKLEKTGNFFHEPEEINIGKIEMKYNFIYIHVTWCI